MQFFIGQYVIVPGHSKNATTKEVATLLLPMLLALLPQVPVVCLNILSKPIAKH